MTIDRNRVGRSFHRQAGHYDLHTSVQKRVVERLLGLVAAHAANEPAEVLDIGCGTGRLLAALHGQYPQMRLCGLDLAYNMTRCARERLGGEALLVNGDAEQLPFRGSAFDLVVSSSTLQWLDGLDLFFRQCRRVMKENGLLCIAFFGGRTLRELRECYHDAAARLGRAGSGGYGNRLHRFQEADEVRAALERSGFGGGSFSCEIETDYYRDVPDLLRAIKCIGAGPAGQGDNPGGLGWRGVLNETSRLYRQRYGTDGMIPVTYEVFYIVETFNGRY